MAQPHLNNSSRPGFFSLVLLSFPGLVWLEQRLTSRRSHPSASFRDRAQALPRWFVFLWMWRAELWLNSVLLVDGLLKDFDQPEQWLRGWRLSLMTPFCALHFSWRYPDYLSSEIYLTQLSLAAWPRRWWAVSEGDLIFRYWKDWTWEKWGLAERVVWDEMTGAVRRFRKLVRVDSQPARSVPLSPSSPSSPPSPATSSDPQ